MWFEPVAQVILIEAVPSPARFYDGRGEGVGKRRSRRELPYCVGTLDAQLSLY